MRIILNARSRVPECVFTNTFTMLVDTNAVCGAQYGYVDMGGWAGGQAEYVMVPYADFNLLKVRACITTCTIK